MSNEKKTQTGKAEVKPDMKKQMRQVNFINVIAAVYVLYLAYQLLVALLAGVAGATNVAMCAGGGVLFLLGGIWLLRREWKNFRRIEVEEEPEVKEEKTAETAGETAAEEEEFEALPEEFLMGDGFLPPEGWAPPQTEEKNTENE